jgi:hypothetical protein
MAGYLDKVWNLCDTVKVAKIYGKRGKNYVYDQQ